MVFDFGGAGIAFSTAYNMVSGVGSALLQGDMASRMSRMQANAYRSQARLAMLQADRQNAYLNEASAQDVWNVYNAGRQLQGQQKAAMAASGFDDISSGDYSLINETARQADRQAYGIKRSAYLQAFENTRQARMEANRLEFAARSAEVMGKMEKRLSKMNAFTSALGALAQGASQYIGYKGLTGNNVSPVGNTAAPAQGGTVDLPDGTGYSYLGKQTPWGSIVR